MLIPRAVPGTSFSSIWNHIPLLCLFKLCISAGDGTYVEYGAAEKSWGGEDDDWQDAETGWFYEKKTGGEQSLHAGNLIHFK